MSNNVVISTSVQMIVDESVLKEGKCISLDSLLHIYGQEANKLKRRALKDRLKRRYGEKLLFVTAENNKCQLVCSKMCLDTIGKGNKNFIDSIPLSDRNVIKKAAEILKSVLKNYVETANDLPWPPTPESLQKRLKDCPELVISCFKHLLHSEDIHHIETCLSYTPLSCYEIVQLVKRLQFYIYLKPHDNSCFRDILFITHHSGSFLETLCNCHVHA